MKAALLYYPGGPENLTVEQREKPTPKKDQILVKVKAFGLNRSELMTRKGLSPSVKLPRILGIECVGIVEEDPSSEYAPETMVACLMGGMGRDYDGSYAEYIVVPKSIVTPFTSKLDWRTLGALPEMFHTVHGSLFLALKAKEDDTLLIRGGTSSIGLLTLKLAKASGLTVISTTRKRENTEQLIAEGADHVIIDNGSIAEEVKKIFPHGVKKVLELVGTSSLKDSLQCCECGGSVCMTGMLSEKWWIDNFSPMDFIPATVNLTVFDTGQFGMAAKAFQDFVNKVERGLIKIRLADAFTLDDIIAAHKLMDSNKANGKIVVTV